MKTDLLNKRTNKIILILLFAAISFACTSISTYAVSVNNPTAKINYKKGLNLRSKSDTSEKSKVVMKLKDNTSITILKEVFKDDTSIKKKDRWYYVEVNGKKGYVRSDRVDNIKYNYIYGWAKEKIKIYTGAGTSMQLVGNLQKDSVMEVYMKAKPATVPKGSSKTWYMVRLGENFCYTPSTNFKLMSTKNIYENMSDDEFVTYLKAQGFNSSYRKVIKKLHKVHPNWEFTGKKMSVSWDDAVKAQNKKGISKIQKSGSSKWVEASKKEVSYYLDPRNFMNEKNAFMFENLNFNSEYQTESVVSKILSGTYLEKNKFKAEYFVTYGKEFNISPVHVASRARQETGGSNGDAINGTKYSPSKKDEKKTVYNPFNIGATDSTDVDGGLKYAYEHGWFTKKKAIKGGTEFLADGYINAGQNTIYFERFNFVNRAASHQYMTNIKAPYSESISTFDSYDSFDITKKPFTFIIPIYSGMPDSTSL